MNSFGSRLSIYVLGIVLSLGACAVDNRLVIESSQGHSNVFTFHGNQLVIPSPSEIKFVPEYGARWALSGDISSLVDGVIKSLESDSNLEVSTIEAPVYAQNITITFGDHMTDGSDSHLFVALDMEMRTTNPGNTGEICKIPAVKANSDQPISHGLFASNEQIKLMILPAYEDLISKTLYDGFIIGFKCLSNKQGR